MITINRTVNLNQLCRVENLSGVVFTGEQGGHEFILTAIKNETVTPLTGSVSGQVRCPDGTAVQMTTPYCEIDEYGRGVVKLAGNCYEHGSGPFGLIVTNVDGDGNRTVIYAAAGFIHTGEAASPVDPENTINVAEIQAYIADMESATDDALAAAAFVPNLVADEYNYQSTYGVGDYVTHEGYLYRCVVAIDTAGSGWGAVKNNFQQVTVGGEMFGLTNAFNEMYATDITNTNTWERGSISADDGTASSSNYRLRTTGFVNAADEIFRVKAKEGYLLSVYAWNNTSGNYIGCLKNGGVFNPGSSNVLLVSEFNVANNPALKYKFVMRRTDSSSIQVSENVNCLYTTRYMNDDAVAPEFDPAVSYAAGDYTLYETEMYRFDSAHTGAWTGSDVTKVSAGAEIAALNTVKMNKNPVALTNSYDLNNITQTGFYRWTNSGVPSNSPSTNGSTLIVNGATTLGNNAQVLVTRKGLMFVRACDTSTTGWSDWYRVSYKGDVDAAFTAAYGYIDDLIAGVNADIAAANASITANYNYFNAAVQSLYNNDLLLNGGMVKGVRNTMGVIASSIGITTKELFVLNPGTKIEVSISGNWIYTVVEGSSTSKMSYTHRLVNDESFVTTKRYVGVTLYKTENGEPVETAVADFTGQVVMHIGEPDNSLDLTQYTRDIPENAGTANVIRRAYQLTKAAFSAEATVPHYGSKTIAEGTHFVGIPYSSVRPENLYVPNCVSIESFMTAAKNPNSYLYTRRMNIPGYYGHCYYGSVCSSFVAWCYGIDETIPTTISFDTYPGFNELPAGQQNWQNVKLGDALNRSGSHIRIITDIYRNRFGDVAYVEISEESTDGKANAQSSLVYRDNITAMIDGGYKLFRYANIADVPYTPSPWVHVDSSEQETPEYNTVIIPRRGDKANWHEGEDVVIDILDGEGYTGYELAVTGGTTETGTIIGDAITLSGLPYGEYKLRLTGTENSDWVFFDVKRTQGTTYEVQAARKVKVTPYIDDGEIGSVLFCCNCPNKGSDHLAVRAFHIFTDEEIEQGYAIVDAPTATSTYAPNDVWYMRCMYKTQYGLYSGQLTAVGVLSAGTTITEDAYARSEYIEDYPGGND